MRSVSRLAAALAGTTALTTALVALPALGAQAAAEDDGLQLVVPTLASMLPGQQGWISAVWKAATDVCDVKVTATAPGLTIGYPTNTGSYTSLYEADKLAADAMDFTALNVSVPASASGAAKATFDVSYTRLPPGQAKKDDPSVVEKFDCKGPKGNQTVTATLPIASAAGAAVLQKTTAVTVARGTPSWVRIAFEARRPGLRDFRVTVAPPAGLEIAYPGEKTSAGLYDDVAPAVAREDYAAVRFDASGLAAGTYRLPVRASYTGGGHTGELALTVE
ncbi:hypothetical protein Ppa06_48380 [Planomonospora parontospora subsp. parontospora]|uniref:Uncharacterized protein n=2 Tax=Planomonospora parontospora TaxID=58119 RepID=A0AA37BJI9_9ACTN|nr:hypothetical protein [Planomonospora parontospora]GGK81663.1 hypothetical protein GCM10010126_46220 [Planomonospora parontospora]GII11040.1 hypothetical protein Ppa06_48380 [Planomonospora parontospora subsp. parontospora]